MTSWSPRRPADSSVVGWLAARTNDRAYGDNPWAQDCVGPGWEAYARIFANPDNGTSWAEVAQRNGMTMHPLADREKISGAAHSPGWNIGVSEGFLWPESWTALCRSLSMETATPNSVYCLIWAIRGPQSERELAPSLEVVKYQNMECWLAEASLDEIAKLDGWAQPDYIWPADHAWTLMSHYDFEYAVVGGTRSLIDAIVASPNIEALEIPADSRWGDTIN